MYRCIINSWLTLYNWTFYLTPLPHSYVSLGGLDAQNYIFKLWYGCWHNLDHFLAFHVEIGHIFLVTLEWCVSQDSSWDVLWMWEEDVSWWAPFCNWYNFLLITTCNMGFTFVLYPIIPNTCHILYKSCLESCILILDSIPSKKAIAPNCIFYVLKNLTTFIDLIWPAKPICRDSTQDCSQVQDCLQVLCRTKFQLDL